MSLSFHWRKSTAASACSCRGIHHPAGMERDSHSPGLSREGAGGDLGRGTAAGRARGQQPRLCTLPSRVAPRPHGTERGQAPNRPQMCVRDGHPG